MNEADLRVQRTRSLLQQALIDLVSEQPYENITIRDITKKAQVGYKTFFRHYAGKDGLLQAMIDQKIGALQAVLAPPSDPTAPHQNTITALRYFSENGDWMLMLLRSSAADQLIKLGTEFGMEEGRLTFGGGPVPDRLVSHHFASSILSLLKWWLENDQIYSVEEMAQYIDQLVIRPLLVLQRGEGG